MNYYELSDIDPYDVLSSFNEDEYERVVQYWIQGYLNKEGKYTEIKLHPKGKDKGRDVSAYKDKSRLIWDNFQCKHYKDPISPKLLRQEIGKICYHSFKGNYAIPENCYFIAPKGLSDDSCTLIYNKHTELKTSIIENWANECKIKKDGKCITLNADLKKHIEDFDFTIFKEITPTTFIEQMQETKYYAQLFKQSINKPIDEHPIAPSHIKTKESNYIKHLINAYSDAEKQTILVANLPNKYKEHFRRQRDSFYCTELVEKITSQSWPNKTPFSNFKKEILNRIIDAVEHTIFANGLARLNECIQRAINHIPSSSNIIHKIIDEPSKQGMCHYLANENQVVWCKDE